MDMREAQEVLQEFYDMTVCELVACESCGQWEPVIRLRERRDRIASAKAALSHIGDGSKAEPVALGTWVKGQEKFVGVTFDPQDMRVLLDHGAPKSCEYIPLYTHPTPTAQDSGKQFDPGTLGFLLEYIGQGDPEVIDGDTYEFLGETEEGLSGAYTHSITDLCRQAAEALRAQDSKVPEGWRAFIADALEILNDLDEEDARSVYLTGMELLSAAPVPVPDKPQLETAEECFQVMESALARIKELNASLQRPAAPEGE